jgi:hypothetical protein
MSSLCYKQINSNTYCQTIEYSPRIFYQTISDLRDPITGEITSLKQITRHLEHLNPDVALTDDPSHWSAEEKLTHVFFALQRVSDGISQDEAELLWNSAMVALLDIILVEPADSPLYNHAYHLFNSICQELRQPEQINDLSKQLSDIFISSGIDLTVHYTPEQGLLIKVDEVFTAFEKLLHENSIDAELIPDSDIKVIVKNAGPGGYN